MKLITYVIVLFFTSALYSQFKDSSEKNVYSIDNATTGKAKFSGGETSAEINLISWEQIYNYTRSVQNVSAKKYNGIFLRAGLLDIKKFVDLDELELSHVGFTVGVSYVHSADTIIDPSLGLYTFKFSFDYKRDNFNNYYPGLNAPERKYPETFTLAGGVTRYLFSKKNIFAFSLNGSFSPKTYNSSQLTNFVVVTPDMINNNIINFEDIDGKYGEVNNKLNGGYFSLSAPIYFDAFKNILKQISLVPYCSSKFISNSVPKYNVGASVGLFPKKLFEPVVPEDSDKKNNTTNVKTKKIGTKKIDNTKIENKKDALKCHAPTFLAIGCGYVFSSRSKASEPNFFVSGTFSF